MERRQACALQKGARRIARCGGGTLRLPAFRFLHFLRLIGRSRSNGRKKDRPHPWPSLDRTGFALDVTTFLQARDPVAVARRKNSRAKTRRENGGACHESTAKLAQRTPSPQRGEGWGEGVRKFEKNLQRPNPLILSFSPLGRRNAAFRPRYSFRSQETRPIPSAPPAPPGSRYATTPKSCRGTPCRNRAPCAPCRSWRQARRAHRSPWCGRPR